MQVTNEQIYAYLVDLSANIAQQFSIVELQNSSIYATVTGISAQTNAILYYLENVINTGINYNTDGIKNIQNQNATTQNQITQVIYQGDYIQTQNTATQNQITQVIYQGDYIQTQNTATQNQITQQTNDINTNTNTALSQYTKTINTNTNESVSTAVYDINSKIEKIC